MFKKEKVGKEAKRTPIKLGGNPNCKMCWGRGYVRVIAPHLDANKFREIRSCHCVKAVVNIEEYESLEVEQVII